MEWNYLPGTNPQSYSFHVIRNGSGITCTKASQTSLSLNTWHLVIATYTASTNTCLIQVDNGTANSTVGSNDPVATTLAVQIGKYNYYLGYVDEVAIWRNHALTSGERTSLWNNGAGLQYPY